MAVCATQAVPILISEEQRAAVRCAGGDQDHVVSLEIEVTLEVMVTVPSDRRQLARSEQIGGVPHG